MNPLLCVVSWLVTLNLLACHQVAAQTPSPVVDRETSLELMTADFAMADGPCWDGWSLIIPDVKAESILRYIPKKNSLQTLVPDAGRISASFFNHGRLYISDNGVGKISFLDGRNKVVVADFAELKTAEEKRDYRPNDLVIDHLGGIYVTFTPQGKVIYVTPEGEFKVAVQSVPTPNGLILSPDGKTLYVSSVASKQIWAYQVKQAGQLSEARQIAAMDDGPARGADGMAMDRAGNVYCAGPSAIWIWSPSGELLDKIACPTKPINCTFGDPDMRSLYITAAGGLYRQRMKISGRAPSQVSLPLKPTAKAPPKQNPSVPSTGINEELKFQPDVVYAQYGERKLLMDIIAPKTKKSHPALIVVHGGGWHNGDKTKFQALSIRLANLGYVVAAIEYRLADEAAFPAAIHDCFAAVRFLRANADQLNINANSIGAVGGSAGAHLVGLMASGSGNTNLLGDGGNPERSSKIQAAVVMAGPLEMLTGSVAERSRSGKGFSNSNSWLRGTVDEKPALYRDADAFVQINMNTCPILFMTGEHDNPARNQRSRDRLSNLRIDTDIKIYKDGKHGCWNRLPWLDEMVSDMDIFLRRHLP
ncbi:SMP-30/gluconolactonase/LRE family protein [bacterium]|nr:SMP-30/gluconolactonase/LRE family protein [bacterium]